MARFSTTILSALLLLLTGAQAQFGFFENMFGQQQQQRQEPQNVPSDSSWYQSNYDQARCTNYLCPDTLACVHFPHHCPCPHDKFEEKFEFGDEITGSKAVCLSKGGFKAGEVQRKVELARKGVL